MTKLLLYLLMSPIMTPAEREGLKQYVRERASAFKCEHLIRDMTPEEEAFERELDERGE
jgi:hypothetical protein